MNFTRKFTIATLLAISTLATLGSTAFAQGSRGGGDIIHCRRGPYKGNSLADTFDLKKKGALLLNTGLSEETLIDSYLDNLRLEDATAAGVIAAQLKLLTFVPVDKIEELDDDGIDLQEPGCEKQQLAIQDIDHHLVQYHLKRYQSLGTEEQALFKIHEAFIAEKKTPGMITTAIRAQVALIPASRSFAEFLAATIYKHQIFRSFKWSEIWDDLISFEAIGIRLTLFPEGEIIREVCTSSQRFQNDNKEPIFGNGPVQTEATLSTVYQGMTNWYGIEFSSYHDFFTVVRDSHDFRELGLGMYAMTNPTWLTIAEIQAQKSQMEADMKSLLKNCPGVFSEQEILNDWDQYQKTISLIQQKP